MDPAFWRHKRVLVTGHTGFKGAWLALWLERLGADVCGIALEPPSTPSLFEVADVAAGMQSTIADIRDRDTVARLIDEHQTEIVLHLAAQSLVRYSYREPLETFSTNVMGTAKVVDAALHADSVRAMVAVTTDKCYENLESPNGYRENDRLGGHDPYAASKACAELVVAAYRRSYLEGDPNVLALASARAGNVIGGGDWAGDRLVPDIVRSIVAGESVMIRSPEAVRPWQHVLDPLSGYLTLAEALFRSGPTAAEAWNFGPGDDDLMTVGEVTGYLTDAWGKGATWTTDAGDHPHETHFLRVDSTKARTRLDWQPRLSVRAALDSIVDWHRAHDQGADMRATTLEQIAAYESPASNSPVFDNSASRSVASVDTNLDQAPGADETEGE